jgi:hypothetical protein
LQFDPANGTLDSIDIALHGSATWTTDADFVQTSLFLHNTHIAIANSPIELIFNPPVTLNYTVNVTVHNTAISELTGTGSTVLDF